ncbi:MAG: hypothetical protein UX26_C0002G0020 [Parcubacteria group bacterium GW2011_GWC1_45_9]|nr:MAG: hypothetical protein UW85_C0004G0006 [Parcubacteria group bacterium GW2011_GWA1_Parcubacteria_45_10]KKT89169.1 MAG: hypothetical protein UW89_C0002G0019 [Parcubacteria group bacterium GW2011_GWB1_45_10]KKU17364.1 MAG: hypothetical protein UX26_C0002G0020 [Parcubacteria group bacterium GW2011_GWC1_45_9]HCI05707.1 hypothetical protein [Patescibacteria group bacterium]
MLLPDIKQVRLSIFKSLIFALAVGSLGFTLVGFISGDIEKKTNSFAEKEKLAHLLATRNETAEELKSGLALIGGNEERMKNAYPPADNILDFVGAVESLASQANLYQTIRFNEPVPAPEILESPFPVFRTDFNIALTGTVVTLISYLEQFEKLPYLAKISSINVSASPVRGWEDASTFSIVGTLYVK